MDVRILDLDRGLLGQRNLRARYRPGVIPLADWGPRVRLGCSFRRFRRFERKLAERSASEWDVRPTVNLFGSGDFHHVSLALLRRQQEPFNLLVLDNHPDWMRGIPVLHCGTWLYHAAQLPQVQQIFHVGGDVDFDNYYRWLAPWSWLQSGKITVLPARRRYQVGPWHRLPHESVRPQPDQPLTRARLEELLNPHRAVLQRHPLYVSLDKDVLVAADATVNWDSGHLRLAEVQELLAGFIQAAQGRLRGLDLLGDWSPVEVEGPFRQFLHWTEHPPLQVEPARACAEQDALNCVLLEQVRNLLPEAGKLRQARAG